VRGLLNLRGQIVTVIDSGVRLGIGKRQALPTSKVIILKTDDELMAKNADPALIQEAPHDIVGLWVDDIGDMVLVNEQDVEPPPANVAGVDARYLLGIIKLEKQLLTIVRTHEIVAID
jgi:purine-binding chemotaxis protein CheW